jgi:hypothetical protein
MTSYPAVTPFDPNQYANSAPAPIVSRPRRPSALTGYSYSTAPLISPGGLAPSALAGGNGAAPINAGNAGSNIAPMSSPAPVARFGGAPMIGGSGAQDQVVTGQAKVDAANRMQQTTVPQFRGVPFAPGETTQVTPSPIPQHLSAANVGSNQITEQHLRMMWDASKAANSQNPQAAAEDFAQTAAKYGVDGHALLNHWTNPGSLPSLYSPAGSAGYTAQQTTPGVSLPVSLVGTDKSGGTPPPGLIPMERGMTLQGAPNVTQTQHAPQGFTSVGKDFLLPSTADLQKLASAADGSAQSTQAARLLPYARIRDQHQQPYTQNDANRIATANAQNLGNVGTQQIAQAPLSPREVFNANVDVANAAAQAPILARAIPAQIAGDAKVTASENYSNAKRDVEDTKANASEANTATKVAGAQKQTETKVAGAKDIQQLKNVGAADAAKLRGAIGGKPGDPLNAQQKSFLMAYAKTAAVDGEFNPRKVEDRIAEARQIMAAATPQAASQPAQPAPAQPAPASNQTPSGQALTLKNGRTVYKQADGTFLDEQGRLIKS